MLLPVRAQVRRSPGQCLRRIGSGARQHRLLTCVGLPQKKRYCRCGWLQAAATAKRTQDLASGQALPSPGPRERDRERAAGVTSVTGNLHSHGDAVYNTQPPDQCGQRGRQPWSSSISFLRPPTGAARTAPVFLRFSHSPAYSCAVSTLPARRSYVSEVRRSRHQAGAAC